MKDEFSPSFDVHRHWLEKLLAETPSPTPSTRLLTVNDSPTEHVLRGSKSFAARSFRSRASGNSLHVPSNRENRSTNDAEDSRQSSGQHPPSTGPVLGEIAPNGQTLRPGPYKFRPSPTPSLKKKKAEAIVRAHGSPQHVRVTAGGRIVPSEQSPLCYPRYGYSAVKTNGGLIKFAPNHPQGKALWDDATQNGFVAQDVDGRLCQIVNGTILPLNEVDGALQLYVHAPNLNITSRVTSRGSSFGPPGQGPFTSNGDRQRAVSQSKRIVPPDPPISAQSNALELEYSKLEHELKELDKTEVLHGRTMSKAAKEALVGKRRELVIKMDNIRKAIKSIKTMPPADAPTSPRAMQKRQSMSPPRNRLPAFLQQRAPQSNETAMQSMPPTFGPLFGMSQPQQYNGQFGFQPTPSPDSAYSNQPFNMAPPGVFVPPPPFDGSLAPPFQPFSESTGQAVQSSHPNGSMPTNPTADDAQLPQTDGARSFADLQMVGPPRQSCAVDIKMPEPKPAAALRSNLNPMSPAYKPGPGVLQDAGNADKPSAKSVKDRAPTPLSPLHQLRPSMAVTRTVNVTEDTISPRKKSPHLHSSSVSSFETADFFPRNTREYSTRKHAYPEPSSHSEGKENVNPQHHPHASDDVPATPNSDFDSHGKPVEAHKMKATPYKPPAPPPGTPIAQDVSKSRPQVPISINDTLLHQQARGIDVGSLPDREAHNLSPKGRRQEYLFVQEHPSQMASQTSSSPEKLQSCREELAVTSSPGDNIDFTEASCEWIEGYRAGLARIPVGSDRAGDFLNGYCAGLLKSKPASSKLGPSTGSPTKSMSRRPSPAAISSRTSSRQQVDHREPAITRPPLETALQSMDTLKEAVFAPQNENAVLTPAAEGPHVSQTSCNLGAWAKDREQFANMEALASTRGDGLAAFPFPDRTSSMVKRQQVMSEGDAIINKHQARDYGNGPGMSMPPVSAASELYGNQAPHSLAPSTTPIQNTDPASFSSIGSRISCMTSIDSNLHRPWPGRRMFSPHLEWKSSSSIAQAAGLAGGNFANAQFDGTYDPR